MPCASTGSWYEQAPHGSQICESVGVTRPGATSTGSCTLISMSTSPHQRVVVVGADGVLGTAISHRLVDAGYEPVPFVRHVERLPGAVRCDLRDPASVREAFSSIELPIAGVVIAAGVVAFGSLGELPAAVVDELFATNAAGVQHVLDAAANAVGDGGFIVNITGVAGEQALVGMSAYCASKAAASMAMRVAKRELRRRGINVIDARPGHTETGLVSRSLWGAPPKLPAGLVPDAVAARIVAAVIAGEAELPPDAFQAS
jgi:cyclic-di-GMP-binding biofilm dispersal mediator protein